MKKLLMIIALLLPMMASAEDTTSAKAPVLDQFLTELLDFAKDAGAFAKEEIPLVLKEYVMWGIVKGAVWVLPMLVVSWYMPRFWRWCVRQADSSDGMSILLLLIASVPWACVLMYNALVMTKAIFAPRVYLIEQLSELIR